jgi:pseudaminic acid cytidylyltransferase
MKRWKGFYSELFCLRKLMSNLCLIPARGGSKRIPRKNIKHFLGKPIIAHSIEEAISSDIFDEIMVSTDDVEIMQIAEQYGANVPFLRSKKNSDDFASDLDVLNEVILQYKNIGKNFDCVCLLYPCAVFISSVKLIEAFELLKKNNYKSIFPIVEFSYPIQRALRLKQTTVKYKEFGVENIRSQDLEKSYHDAGQFYFIKTSVITNNEKIVGNKSGAIIVSELESQDIDSDTDWKLAELKYKLLQK